MASIAFEKGYDAYSASALNPYEEGTQNFDDWLDGWECAEAEMDYYEENEEFL